MRTRNEQAAYNLGTCRVLGGSVDFRVMMSNVSRFFFDKVCNDAEQGTGCCPNPTTGLEGQPYATCSGHLPCTQRGFCAGGKRQAASGKLQAAGGKRQAASRRLLFRCRRQAAGGKRQAASRRRQARGTQPAARNAQHAARGKRHAASSTHAASGMQPAAHLVLSFLLIDPATSFLVAVMVHSLPTGRFPNLFAG